MVSIHRPLGYGPNTLPLRHPAIIKKKFAMSPLCNLVLAHNCEIPFRIIYKYLISC